MNLFTKTSVFFLSFLYSVSMPLSAEPLGTPDYDEIIFPDDEENTEGEIELGRTLFFDTRLSGNGSQSCATCHNPDLGMGDGLALGLGSERNALGRNTPHLYNLAWNVIFMWDGRKATLEEQALGPIEAEVEMNMPLDELVDRLKGVPYYQKEFAAVYGDSGITKENIGHAIAAFERTFAVTDTPFDRYIAGDKAAMGPAAVRGMKLFEGKANCIACHDGPNFTDNSFHNIGLKSRDLGRYEHVKSEELKFAFKTPGLRNILLTAPYMHDGSEPTLEAVVEFYNRGGDIKEGISKNIKPLDLNENEVQDLVAFMGALTQPLDIKRPYIP